MEALWLKAYIKCDHVLDKVINNQVFVPSSFEYGVEYLTEYGLDSDIQDLVLLDKMEELS